MTIAIVILVLLLLGVSYLGYNYRNASKRFESAIRKHNKSWELPYGLPPDGVKVHEDEVNAQLWSVIGK